MEDRVIRNSHRKRLLVLVGHKENRRLLTNWLAQYYDVFIPTCLNDLSEPFDLGLLDMHALRQLLNEVKARKQAEHPVFLPTMLIASREEAEELTNQIWQTIDEVLITPIEKGLLQIRLEILLRVRELGLDLAQSNQQLKLEIDERVQAEQRLKVALQAEAKARQEAEQANELKSKFLAMISHELRTPLTPIKGFASTLLATDVIHNAHNQKRFIEIIDQEADRLLTLVNDLLDLTQLQAGTFKIFPQPIPVTEILSIARIPLQAMTAKHQLEIELDENLPPVLADVERIRQVLLNIVGNAVKFTPAGKRIHIQIHLSTDSVQVDISDEGVGIPHQDRLAIFEAFHQSLSNGQYNKGAGLGLAICKGIVQAHQGEIWVADKAPPGTVISFTLPTVAERTVLPPSTLQ
jgi:signal transduction histidine kinase